MNAITTAALPAVPHVVFGIFNLAVPNIIFWAVLIVVFIVSARMRLPRFMEHSSKDREEGDR